MPDIHIKRIYDKPAEVDGFRILVDRLWPRGLTKQAASINLWLKNIAPSNELRHWYSHEPEKWQEFQKRYRQELKANPESVKLLKEKIKEGPATLLYSSKEPKLNNAAALAQFLENDQI